MGCRYWVVSIELPSSLDVETRACIDDLGRRRLYAAADGTLVIDVAGPPWLEGRNQSIREAVELARRVIGRCAVSRDELRITLPKESWPHRSFLESPTA